MRAKTKQAKNAKKRAESERSRYIFKGNIEIGLEWEYTIQARNPLQNKGFRAFCMPVELRGENCDEKNQPSTNT